MAKRTIRRRQFLSGVGAAAVGAAASPAQGQGRPPAAPADVAADLILLNGKIITIDSKSTVAEAIAVAGDKIIAVGSIKEMLRYRHPETRGVDLKGKAVIPGITDGHA